MYPASDGTTVGVGAEVYVRSAGTREDNHRGRAITDWTIGGPLDCDAAALLRNYHCTVGSGCFVTAR